MKIYVMRHGETDANRQRLFQGTFDFPLNDFGKELAKWTGEGLKDVHFDICYCSPLQRAKQTADIVLKESGNSDCPVIYDERLKEINAGTMEGKNINFAEDDDKKLISTFFNRPYDEFSFPQGESFCSIKKRTQEILKEIIKTDAETVLISSHGCAYRAMLNFLYENKEDFWQGHPPFNCAISILETDGESIRIIEHDKIYYDRKVCENFYVVK